MDKSKLPYILVIIALVIMSVVFVIKWQSTDSQLLATQGDLQIADEQNDILESANAGLRDENNALSQQNNALKSDNQNLQNQNADLEDENSELEAALKGTLPYSKASGWPITLRNNYAGVHNPSWQEVKSFLEADHTEAKRYIDDIFVCGDFAELLHNEAESQGIRAAVVIVQFSSGPSHAINAFYTTDEGLVYIDDTGEGFSLVVIDYSDYGLPIYGSFEGKDKVAYLTVGEEYGLIEIDSALSLSYGFYREYQRLCNEYNTAVVAYNVEVDAYNEALGGRIFLEEPEYSYFTNWYNRLESQHVQLETMAASLGDHWYEPLGIVSSIEIYWNAIKWDGL